MCEYFAVKPVIGKLEEQHPVLLIHWWPGREYKRPEELPTKFKKVIKRARKSNNKYATFACTFIPGVGEVCSVARCLDMDVPSRKYGRDHALGLLKQELLGKGYTLVAM